MGIVDKIVSRKIIPEEKAAHDVAQAMLE